MVTSRFHTPEVLAYSERLYAAHSPSDILRANDVLGSDSSGIDAMVSLPDELRSSMNPFVMPPTIPQRVVVPYLCYPYVYFSNHGPLIRPLLRIDYSITCDSNVAGYIDRAVVEKSLNSLPGEVKNAIADILCHDLNFDLMFYFMENIKQTNPIVLAMKNSGNKTPQKFWESLDVGFRQNMKNLQQFRAVNCDHYRKTGEFKYSITDKEAEEQAINFSYDFYASDKSQELRDDITFRQKTILFILLLILRVQFSSSKGAKKKTFDFLDVIQKTGVYFDRETIIAHKYFKNRKTIPLLEKVNRGGTQKNIMDTVDNLAWDMTAPRFMEKLAAIQPVGVDYWVPYFLTFDPKLRELIECYPVKAVIIDRKSGGTLSIPKLSSTEYFEGEDCEDIIKTLFSQKKREERFAREVPTLEILTDRINDLCKELNTVLGSQAFGQVD